MIGAPLGVYFFFLVAGLAFVLTGGLSLATLLIMAAIGLIGLAVIFAYHSLANRAGRVTEIGIDRIFDYLDAHGVPYQREIHQPAPTAEALAHATSVSDARVAKPVMVRADGKLWMVVLPAADLIDFDRLREELHADNVKLVSEDELVDMFPGCETGAEPPFGRLFEIDTITDISLLDVDSIICHAGSHDESVEIPIGAYTELERPVIGKFAVPRD